MPDLKELLSKREKKQFVKKSYRPWDLSGSNSTPEETAAVEENTVVALPKVVSNVVEIQPEVTTPRTVQAEPVSTPAPESISKSDNNLDIKLDSKQVTVRDQLDNRKISVGYQLDNNSITIRDQLDNNWVQNQITNRSDLGELLNPNSIKNQLSKITGIQKRIMDVVVDLCTANKKLETGPLLTSGLASCVLTTIGTVKMSLKRLIDRDFLKRGAGRTAPGGYICLHIEQEIYDLVLQLRKEKEFFIHPMNSLHNHNPNSAANLDNKLDNNFPYSSSNNINTTTNNSGIKNFELPEGWSSIDFSNLSHIGFTQTQLKQLVDKNLPEVVQESIDFFAYDISQNPEKYKQPLNVIMGVLRKGNGWSKPAGYESPKDKALREYTERKKAEVENRNKLLEELMVAEFSQWESNLSEEDLENILPADVRNSRLSAAKISTLKNHFREQVLIPRLKKEGLY